MTDTTITKFSMPNSGDFAADLRSWITARGITQREAAALLSVPYTTLTGWVQGRFRPDLEGAIRKLADLV